MVLLSGGVPLQTGLGRHAGMDLADRSPSEARMTYHSTSVALTGRYAAYAELYKAQPWIYVLVRKLGTSVSRLPLKVYERKSDTERTSARATAYGELIRRPHPTLGAKLLWNWVSSTVELYGEAMLLKRRDHNGRVRELHPLHPANLLVRRSEVTGEIEYAYTSGNPLSPDLLAFSASEIVHFRGYNPDNTRRGLSPCEPLRQTLLSEDAMRRAQSALWRNGARPSVALSHPGQLSQPAADRLKASWDAAHSGVDSWGKTAILEEGMVPHIVQLNAEELQYLASRQLNRDECCAVYDVPPPAVQILDRATFSNITEQMRSLYRETMAPRLEAYEDTLSLQLAPDFDRSGDLYAEFDLDAVLRGSFEARIEAKARAIQTGQITPAESRAEENLPFIVGSDQLLVNAALIPLAVAQATPPSPGTPSVPAQRDVQAEQGAVKGLSPSDGRTLAGRLSRCRDVALVDPGALVAGLDAPDVARSLLAAAVARGTDVPTLRRWIAASTDPLELL